MVTASRFFFFYGYRLLYITFSSYPFSKFLFPIYALGVALPLSFFYNFFHWFQAKVVAYIGQDLTAIHNLVYFFGGPFQEKKEEKKEKEKKDEGKIDFGQKLEYGLGYTFDFKLPYEYDPFADEILDELLAEPVFADEFTENIEDIADTEDTEDDYDLGYDYIYYTNVLDMPADLINPIFLEAWELFNVKEPALEPYLELDSAKVLSVFANKVSLFLAGIFCIFRGSYRTPITNKLNIYPLIIDYYDYFS